MEDVLKIINHYGVNSQQRKFAEEVFELQEAITKAINPINVERKFSIAEEIADCIVLLTQFKEYYQITDEQINDIIDYKIDRQLKRIEKEGVKE